MYYLSSIPWFPIAPPPKKKRNLFYIQTETLKFVLYQYPSEPRKSASMRLPAERENGKDVEQYPSKSKRLLKALLSRRKSKKDDMLYTYLDEY